MDFIEAWKLLEKINRPISLIAYHSSAKKFNKFDLSKVNTGTNDGGMFGKGMYFTESPELAKAWNDTGYLYKVKLNIKNPIILETDEDRENFFAEYSNRGINNINTEKIITNGFDGIISNNEIWTNPQNLDDITKHSQYVIFDTNDIEIIEVTQYSENPITNTDGRTKKEEKLEAKVDTGSAKDKI